MNLAVLDSKKFHVLLKNGAGITELCRRYECTQDELIEKIKEFFSKEKDFKRAESRLKSNSKNSRKRRKNAPATPSINVANDSAEALETQTPTPPASTASTLNELEKTENELSEALLAREKEHKDISSKITEVKKSFGNIMQEMMDLKRCYEAKGHEAERVAMMYEELVQRRNQLRDENYEQAIRLKNVRAQIRERRKLTISVEKDGVITVYNTDAEVVDVSDEGHQALYDMLKEREEAEDFRPRDLRVIAKVIQIARILESSKILAEVLSDNEDIRNGYEIFK
ncbi:hypothetical protein IJH15_00965 [Candidatus Saccharibacteria bacterium]|nr:hypothetical protein [Candidatus Saccharibacteria bacterium]MBQ6313465.1 hypothetical protein [Candidatus Saccharibacteria bacterium]